MNKLTSKNNHFKTNSDKSATVNLKISNLSEMLDWMPQLISTDKGRNQAIEILNDLSVKDLTDMGTQRILTLESSIKKFGTKIELLEPLLDNLGKAGQNKSILKQLEVWLRFSARQIDVNNEQVQKYFAPYLVTDGKRAVHLAKSALKSEGFDLCASYLKRVSLISSNTQELTAAAQLIDKLNKKSDVLNGIAKHKVAILGGMTTLYLTPILKAIALGRSILLETYEAEYNMIDIEVHNPTSQFYSFEPDTVIIIPASQHLDLRGNSVVENEVVRWETLWDSINEKLKARIIHVLYDEVVSGENLFLHLTQPTSSRYKRNKINRLLIEKGGANISFVDYEGILSNYGRNQWVDERGWHLAKQPIDMKYLGVFARHIISSMAIDIGKSKRIIAVDLDNTLWGGVLGEEGIFGVKAGQGDPESEQFLDFQKYLKELSELGCILVAVSKNDEHLVKEAFVKRKDDFIISWDDFANYRINWVDKSTNIKSLSEEMSLPLEHFVFVDDNPTERMRVRQELPEVTVPELPVDVGGYKKTLEHLLLFEKRNLTKEDALRLESYKLNRQRNELKSKVGSLDTYLKDLDMVLEVCPFDSSTRERAAQLIAKTNQFNLTTIRYSLSELESMADTNDSAIKCYRLVDRFGDYGWIGIMILKQLDESLTIDSWLMSCRVLGKTVEECMIKDAFDYGQSRNCKKLLGTYIPTKKNGLVSELYDRLGFSRINNSKGNIDYSLDLTCEPKLLKNFIRRKEIGFES